MANARSTGRWARFGYLAFLDAGARRCQARPELESSAVDAHVGGRKTFFRPAARIVWYQRMLTLAGPAQPSSRRDLKRDEPLILERMTAIGAEIAPLLVVRR